MMGTCINYIPGTVLSPELLTFDLSKPYELKYCEQCSRLFMRSFSIQNVLSDGGMLVPFRVGPRVCDSCVARGVMQFRDFTVVMTGAEQRERDIRDAIDDERHRARKRGAEHPRTGQIHKRTRLGRHTSWIEPLRLAMRERALMTAGEMNAIIGYTNAFQAAYQACQKLDLVVIGFVPRAGRGKRYAAVYGFRPNDYKAPTYQLKP